MILSALLAAGEVAAPDETASRVAAPKSREVPSTSNDVAHMIGKQLRCPVCQGMPISESPSTMAQDMMKRVGELLAEGKTPDEVQAYFVSRYGEWVVLKPPTRGFFILVWILPPIALIALLAWGIAHMRGLRAGPRSDGPTARPVEAPGDDAFTKAIRDEVRR